MEPVDTARGSRIVCIVDLLEPYAVRGRRVKSGGKGGGSESGDQALQLREHMAGGNVIRLKGHWVHKIWGYCRCIDT